jgi:purine-binding chemotaxis protein CheW
MKLLVILNQREKKLKAEVTTSESVQIVSFSLVNELNKKKENYGVPIEQVKEIRSFENITKVPKAKHFVKGIMNLRGMIIPVVDVKKRLGFGETKELNKNHRILIADVRDSVYGLIVDNVDQVMQITIKDIEPIPPDSFESHHYIKGIAKVKGKLIVLLDIIALFEFEQDSDNSNNQKEIEELKTFRNNSEIENKNIQAKDLESTTENDIPDVLKEVFKEDEEKNSLKESTS